MSPKRPASKSSLYAFRLPEELIDRVDAYAKALQEETAWRRVTRADAVRSLLNEGLYAREKRTGKRSS